MSELPVSPRTKTDYRECLRVCHEWADELDDPEPFDEWAEQLARRMDMDALSVQRRRELAAIRDARGHPHYDATLKELIENFNPSEGE